MSRQYKPKNPDQEDSQNPRDERDTHENRPARRNDYQGPRHKKEPQEKYPRDESKITYYATLPEIPTVKKTKPNEENFRAKMKDLEDSLAAAKAERKSEKEAITKATSSQTLRIEELNRQIQLGRDILKLLDQDEMRADYDAKKFKSMIFDYERRKNKGESRVQTRGSKKPEEMNVEEIDAQIERYRQRLINESLNKKETAEISSAIEKLKTQKLKAPSAPVQAEKTQDKSDEEIDRKIAQYTEDLNRQLRRQVEAKVKIDLITTEIANLESEKTKVIKEKETVENGPENAKARELKEKIRSIRTSIQDLDSKYHAALDAWTDEQAFMEYINWANEVKKRKTEENEILKEERRRQKGKEARRNEKEKDNKDPKEGEEKERVRPPPPHPYAREIENVRFLVNYVERLKPETKAEAVSNEPASKKDIKTELSKGAWTKEKGIEVIVSKKDREIDAPSNNNKKDKKEKVVQKSELPSGQFEHSIEIVRLFDNLKVLPPKTEQELDTVLTQLEERRQYYLSAKPEERAPIPGGNRDGKPYRRREEDQREQPRQAPQGNTQKKPAISLGDFPEL